MDDLRTRIAERLRSERESRGLAVSELARRAGISKATVSQLESGTANPTVETLWAIGDALGVPFSTLVEAPATGPRLVRAGDYAGIPAAAAPYLATLLSASPPGARRDIYVITAEPGNAHVAEPHAAGAVEHVILTAGRAQVGPELEPVELAPGDYLSYTADVAHVFRALSPGTAAVLINELR
ncbi:helix-turn-helix domain-containing protein [Microbacterium gorillae]|uniref:helix-turn-helix domain-containing protein n=1 Tax=Microbacterium gorillae TaxID=1231063 RepID=UPI00058CF9C7|nr:XRE family transcriptional regulator [Microbacterium gorillae]